MSRGIYESLKLEYPVLLTEMKIFLPKARIIRIQDTLHLDSFLATESLLGEIRRQDALETDEEMMTTCFDAQGRLYL